MSVVRTSEPGTEPVTLSEVKAQCRVDTTDEDTLLTSLIAAARQMCEQQLQRALITQTWKMTLDAFPDWDIDLPYPTLQSVTSVKYYDSSNVQQTMVANTDYFIDTAGQPGRVLPVTDWPTTYERPDAVEIIYVAGYANAAAVPQAIKQWLLVQIAAMFDNRSGVPGRDAQVKSLPFVDALLDPYRVWVV